MAAFRSSFSSCSRVFLKQSSQVPAAIKTMPVLPLPIETDPDGEPAAAHRAILKAKIIDGLYRPFSNDPMICRETSNALAKSSCLILRFFLISSRRFFIECLTSINMESELSIKRKDAWLSGVYLLGLRKNSIGFLLGNNLTFHHPGQNLLHALPGQFRAGIGRIG